MHPRFADYVEEAIQLGFRVVVFTGGIMPAAAMDCICRYPPDLIHVVFNVADPDLDPPEWLASQRTAASQLGERAMLGVNLRSRIQHLSYLLEWQDQFSLAPAIRIGMAQPTWNANNRWFRFRRPCVLPVVEDFYMLAEQSGLRVDLDCGFTPCMFSDPFLDEHPSLFRRSVISQTPTTEIIAASPAGRCGAAIDILPEGTCIACYATAEICRLELAETESRDDLIKRVEAVLAQHAPYGMFPDCDSCTFRFNGMCDGGCRARRFQRFRASTRRGEDISQRLHTTRDST